MSQKKVKGVQIYLTVKQVQALEDTLISKAHFLGGLKKLKKTELDVWHILYDICKELKLSDYKFEKKIDKSLH
jgi:hypothetical protein